MRRLLVAAALTVVAMPFGGAQATHGGCVVHTAQPTCTYSAVGTHSALGFSEGPWEVTVMRPVNGEPTKVVVGGGAGGPIAIEDIATNFGEEATIEMKAADGAAAPVGIISVGNTAEHI